MEEETVYTDDEIREIAENVAKEIREISTLMIGYVIKDPMCNGPFGFLRRYSAEYNPLGKFPVEPEALTMKQKGIITKIVGKGMIDIGKDHPDYEKNKRRSEKEFLEQKERDLIRSKPEYGFTASELRDLKEAGRDAAIFRAIDGIKVDKY